MELTERLTDIFEAVFGKDAEFRPEVTSDHRIGGTLVSGSFEQKTEIERQRMIWAELEKELPDHDLNQIVLIIPNTPDEDAAFEEERSGRREDQRRDEERGAS